MEDGPSWHGKWHRKLWSLEGGRRNDFRNCVINFLMTSLAGPNRAFHMVGAQYVSPLSPLWFRDGGTFRTSAQGRLSAEGWASACTNDDITLVGSMLVDKDNSVKIQALNTLKAFSGIRKFRLKIQEHSIKVLELISTIWDSELHIAGLRLLNNLPLPDFAHPQLRRVMPALMEILQSDYILAQVQAARLLSNLAQKNDLLYDILNCQVHSNFLDLFQSTQPGSLLLEVLVFAEWLSEGRSSPHYRAVKWHYNEQSVHEALFGDDSRLADRLLALVIHPEEDVQIQACKVIVSLQCPQDVGVQPSCPPSHSCFNNAE
nr:armadillo repeat-containing protein 12 isoform X4 [Kogia breviceps]